MNVSIGLAASTLRLTDFDPTVMTVDIAIMAIAVSAKVACGQIGEEVSHVGIKYGLVLLKRPEVIGLLLYNPRRHSALGFLGPDSFELHLT